MFPSNPSVGQLHTDPFSGVSHVYNGTKWMAISNGVPFDMATATIEQKLARYPELILQLHSPTTETWKISLTAEPTLFLHHPTQPTELQRWLCERSYKNLLYIKVPDETLLDEILKTHDDALVYIRNQRISEEIQLRSVSYHETAFYYILEPSDRIVAAYKALWKV